MPSAVQRLAIEDLDLEPGVGEIGAGVGESLGRQDVARLAHQVARSVDGIGQRPTGGQRAARLPSSDHAQPLRRAGLVLAFASAVLGESIGAQLGAEGQRRRNLGGRIAQLQTL